MERTPIIRLRLGITGIRITTVGIGTFCIITLPFSAISQVENAYSSLSDTLRNSVKTSINGIRAVDIIVNHKLANAHYLGKDYLDACIIKCVYNGSTNLTLALLSAYIFYEKTQSTGEPKPILFLGKPSHRT
ncbi:hypothetical protein GCM10007877_23010 [Marinibactrum halimedae]|uniref:Uncharacterized protein n=1 Tax=Marinibactrum halimedae TaxID=1444977 RepID=A0AA37WMQ4_9GAMM|nr:hypothetical protein GCM10007877_23010 [Marinibactrum halimedae]